MKVALIDPNLFSLPYDSCLIEALASLGCDVRLFGCKRVEEQISNNAMVVPHYYEGFFCKISQNWPRPFRRVSLGLQHAVDNLRLEKALEAWQPEIIHFQWLPIPLLDGRLIRRLKKIAPVVFTHHNTVIGNGDKQNFWQSFGIQNVLRTIDDIIVHSIKARERVIEQGINCHSISVVRHGLLDMIVDNEFKATRNVEFLMFGKIRNYKGIDILIEAIILLPEVYRDRIKIKIVGKPYMDTRQLSNKLEQAGIKEPHVVLKLTHVSQEELRELFKAASVILMPYREVDASGILSLAIAYGKPVIGTTINGLTELLEDGRDSLLVAPDDAIALAGSMLRFADNLDLQTKLHEGMKKQRIRVADWKDIATETLDIYKKAILRRD